MRIRTFKNSLRCQKKNEENIKQVFESFFNLELYQLVLKENSF